MLYKKHLTPEQALQKAKHYCAYQERSHSEVKQKLYDFGLYKKDVEQLLSKLIEENYLNEERFAILFAGGKFRMKYWGKKKIEYELKQKGVSSYCIRKALSEIKEDDYLATLHRLAETKWLALKGEQYISRQGKTQQYLLQKGYEVNYVSAVVKRLATKQ